MYYLISFIYKGVAFYCIWFSEDEDYVLANKKQLIYFKTIDEVEKYTLNNNILIQKEKVAEYNLDRIGQWCEDQTDMALNCNEILNLWNICTDVANGLKEKFIGNDTEFDNLYEKIFISNNLFDEDTNQNRTIPDFAENEIKDIKRILKSGIKVISESIE